MCDEPCRGHTAYRRYFGSLMEVRRSHTFASWFSRSIKYMSPEISTTTPIPLGICTLSLSLGLQTSMGLFLVVRGNAPTCLTDLRNELNPPRGGFVIILLLSGFWPIIWIEQPWTINVAQPEIALVGLSKAPRRSSRSRSTPQRSYSGDTGTSVCDIVA